MAGFGSWTSKVDLFHPFGCKKDSKITKNGIKSLFGTLGALHTQKATQEWKLTLRWLGEAKIGPDAPHAVQLTCLGPKKTILRPLVQNLIFSHGMTQVAFVLLIPCMKSSSNGLTDIYARSQKCMQLGFTIMFMMTWLCMLSYMINTLFIAMINIS